MIAVFSLLAVQGVLGAFDNLWHHELQARLPATRSARGELFLHAIREFIYAAIFLGLAWYEWHGVWAYILATLVIVELPITIADFLVEDETRRLPRLERALHTILAINVGAVLALLVPVVYTWSQQPTQLVGVEYSVWSWLFSAYGIGVLAWGIRNLAAVLHHLRPPAWQRRPIRRGQKLSPRTILVTGATGFIGCHLVRALVGQGDKVLVLTRDRARAENLFGKAVSIVTSLEQVGSNEPVAVIVNLAGAPILGWPWTSRRRAELIQSRVVTTKECLALIRRLKRRPALFLSASAVGFYGTRDDQFLDESSQPRSGFQSELCKAWECAAAPAETRCDRVVRLRLGLVLGVSGGAFSALIRPIRWGFGAVLGNGRQYLSWIHIADAIRLIEFVIDNPRVTGVVNATAPEPVTQREFVESAANTLGRKILLRVPAWPIRWMLGEMSELLVDGQRVVPNVAQSWGFRWRYAHLPEALEHLIHGHRNPAMVCSGVVFDASCPVCRAEIGRFERIDRGMGGRMTFFDAGENPTILADYGLSQADLRRRLYVYDAEGSIRSGFDADVVLLEQFPSLRRVARVLRWPAVFQVLDLLYDIALAPALARYAARLRAAGATSLASRHHDRTPESWEKKGRRGSLERHQVLPRAPGGAG